MTLKKYRISILVEDLHTLSAPPRSAMSHPFHALQKTPEDLRSTADVFSSVAKNADRIGSRFSSGGKFTEQQFKAGEDATEPQVEDGEVQAEGEAEDGAPGKNSCFSVSATWSPHRSVTISPARDVALHAPVFCAVYDPNDRRSLYDRLKEQKDAKQEEWEEQHKFKNQMDHWKLDVDDAAFEEVRVALSPSMPSCLFTPFVVPATATAVGARACSCAHGDHLLPRMPL